MIGSVAAVGVGVEVVERMLLVRKRLRESVRVEDYVSFIVTSSNAGERMVLRVLLWAVVGVLNCSVVEHRVP